jgi:hypothetical protein
VRSAILALDEEVARQAEDNGKFRCPLCLDDCSVEDVFLVEDCGHYTCRDCMLAAINTDKG